MEKKILLWAVGIVLLSAIGGYLVHAETSDNDKQKYLDKVMNYCNNDLLPAYEAGFMNSLITDLDAFARNCKGDVKLFSWVRVNGEKEGILFQCDTTNVTYPLKYPNIEGFRK